MKKETKILHSFSELNEVKKELRTKKEKPKKFEICARVKKHQRKNFKKLESELNERTFPTSKFLGAYLESVERQKVETEISLSMFPNSFKDKRNIHVVESGCIEDVTFVNGREKTTVKIDRRKVEIKSRFENENPANKHRKFRKTRSIPPQLHLPEVSTDIGKRMREIENLFDIGVITDKLRAQMKCEAYEAWHSFEHGDLNVQEHEVNPNLLAENRRVKTEPVRFANPVNPRKAIAPILAMIDEQKRQLNIQIWEAKYAARNINP